MSKFKNTIISLRGEVIEAITSLLKEAPCNVVTFRRWNTEFGELEVFYDLNIASMDESGYYPTVTQVYVNPGFTPVVTVERDDGDDDLLITDTDISTDDLIGIYDGILSILGKEEQ